MWNSGWWHWFVNQFKPKPKIKFAIDVSKHNGVIVWSEVARHTPKVDLAIIKATEGVDFVDIKFMSNARGAKAAGLLVGYYHFASLNKSDVVSDARAEALDFIEAMKSVPKADIPPVLDLEENRSGLMKSVIQRWVETFLHTMAANGYPEVIMYSYTPFLDGALPVNHPFGRMMKLWVAGYVRASRLKIPNGWDKYWMWQYSSTGTVRGIKGPVDLNTTKPLSEIIETGIIVDQ